MLIALLVTGIATLLLLGLGVMRWLMARNVEGVVEELSETALPLLPEGHRPPPGLSPLSPSERFLTAEAERGLRDLEEFLLDAA